MKKILLSLILLATSSISLVSCTDEDHDPVASVAQNIILSTPAGADYVLTAPTAADDAATIKWSSADFGYSASVTYSLQVVKGTADFSQPQSLALGNFNDIKQTEHEKTITQRQLNSMLLGAGGGIGTSDTYKMRVIGTPSTQLASSANGVKAISQEITFTANPFDTFDEFDRLYVPGNFGGTSTYGSWDPANAPKLFSANNNGKFEGFVWMNDASPEFKFTPGTSWDDAKGESSPTGAFTGILGGENIKASGAGTYFFTIDWLGGTYTMAKRTIAIIGAATPNGWDKATDLVFDIDPASPYYRMYTKDLVLKADEFLVRLQDDWSVKMGTSSGNPETLVSKSQNKIKFDGANMKVPEAGNYKVVLDLSNAANYNIKLIPN